MVTWSPRPPAAPVTRSTAPSAARMHMWPECAPFDPRVILRRRSRPYEGGEPACRLGSVRPLARGGGHPSGTAVAGSLVRPTREHRAGRPRSLAQGAAGSPLDLAPGGVYRAAAVTCGAGGLLHHRFTLTPANAGAVYFLWHCPAGHPGSALPTTLPCGARTFLTGLAPGATARPTHPCSGYAGYDRARVANRTGACERRQRFDRRRHRDVGHRTGAPILGEHSLDDEFAPLAVHPRYHPADQPLPRQYRHNRAAAAPLLLRHVDLVAVGERPEPFG